MLIRIQIFVVMLAIGTIALAQGAVETFETQNHLPAGFITTIIGIVGSLLMGPATAIAKKLGKTNGPSTVMVNVALSFVVVAVCGHAAHLYAGWPEAIYAAFVSVVMSQGTYLMQANAEAKGRADYYATQAKTADPPSLIQVGSQLPSYLMTPTSSITNPAFLNKDNPEDYIREVG